MSRILRGGLVVWMAVFVLALGRPVLGVIKVELPVSKLVEQSRAVVVGRVSGVDLQRRTIQVEAMEKIKGDIGRRFRVVVAEGPEAGEVGGLLETISTGGAVVIFVEAAREAAVLHLGDRWVRGQRVMQGDEPLWRVAQAYDGGRSFPGRTGALADVVREIRAGGIGLQDWVSHEVCVGGVHQRAEAGLAGPPTFLLTHDLNGDGMPDVITGNAKEVRVLLAQGRTYVDQTVQWGLAEARGLKAAAADLGGDAAADLIIGSRIWVRAGETFVGGATLDLGDQRQWVAMGAGDAVGDGRADVAVLLRDGRMLTAENPGPASAAAGWKVTAAALWNDGADALAAAFADDFGDNGRLHAIVVRADSIARYPAGAASATADFARLTGIPLASYGFLGAMPIRPLLVAAYDYDGLGRTDFLLVTQGGGIALANRGHGAFLINRFAHEQFRPGGRDIKLPKLPFEPSLSGALTAPGRQVQMQPKRKRGNLLVLTDKGQLWEMDNERRR